MPRYNAPLTDIRFVLHEVLGSAKLQALPGYAEATPDTIDAILEEAAKMASEVLQPLNLSGDSEGCKFDNGKVTTPAGFKEAYKLFCESGWTAMTADPDYGGQGLPKTLGFVIDEMICSANLSFGMYPGLSHGAYNALLLHGSDAQKETYLPKLVTGEWSGTMCLTEPHCGTDLGLIRTRAEPSGGDSYVITGTKIFISAGEHDLTENILHLVLAKLPDAPAGTRGISLFLVPKFLSDGKRNTVSCGSIEHKMGIKASSTCVMNFEGAVGYLIGQPHSGMKAMFTMMNAARLGVAMQGLGLAEVAYQNAVDYAKNRLQGRSLSGVKAPDKIADPLIVHPDIRKNLMTIKAINEAARSLAYRVGMALDIETHHPDANERTKAADYVALMTPITKAFFTDHGFEGSSLAVQIYGGHGYIHEYGMEQFVRDARITQIYEGANGIQALDLVGRKLPEGMGRLLRRFFEPLDQLLRGIEANSTLAAPEFVQAAGLLGKAFAKLQQATMLIATKGVAKPEEAGAAATDYLRMFALVALGAEWLQMAMMAQQKLSDGSGLADKEFYSAKLITAQFYFAKILPQVNGLFLSIQSGAKPIMALPEEAF